MPVGRPSSSCRSWIRCSRRPRKDLDEALRQQAGGMPLAEVESAVLERDGKLSIIKRWS
jgi:uncharacterized membrane protein YcaP (DUF421 family)